MEEVSITQEDNIYRATFNIENRIMTVTYDGDEKARKIDDDAGHPLELAKAILGEMVKAKKS
jgi:hypothetical protein